MRRFLVLLPLFFLFAPASLRAGSGGWLDGAPFKRYEIVLSYGGLPYHPYRFDPMSHILPGYLVHNSGRFETSVKTRLNFTLEGAWFLNSRLAVTQLFGYHVMETEVYDSAHMTPASEKWVNEQTPYYLYTAGIRYVYVIHDHYRLYGEVQGGYVWKNKNLKYFEIFPDEAKRGLTGEVIPLALQTTGRLFLNLEMLVFGEYANLTSSNPSLGMRIGAGFRF